MKEFLLKIETKEGKQVYRHFSEDNVTIGSSPFNCLHLPLGRKASVHSIIQRRDNNFRITKINPQTQLKVSGQNVSVKELNHNDTVSVNDYKLTLITPKNEDKIKSLRESHYAIGEIDTTDQDRKLKKALLIGVGLALIFFGFLSFLPKPEEVQIEDISERFSRLVIDPVATKTAIVAKKIANAEGEGAKAKKEEGEAENKKAEVKNKRKKKRKKVSKALRKKVRTKGVLGALRSRGVRKQLASVIGAGSSFGRKFDKALGGSKSKKGLKAAFFKGTIGSGVKGIDGDDKPGGTGDGDDPKKTFK